MDEYKDVDDSVIDIIVKRSAFCYIHRQSDSQLTIIPIHDIKNITVSADSKLDYF